MSESSVENEKDLGDDSSIWCVIANVKKEHPFGPGGTETKYGTKQFRGGTKVYIAGCNAGTADSVLAIGLHRYSRKFISCIIHVNYVENFRVKLAYHPAVLNLINSDERCWIKTQEEAENMAAAFSRWQARLQRPAARNGNSDDLSRLQ